MKLAKLSLNLLIFCSFGSFLLAQEKRTLDWQNFNKSVQDAYIADPVPYGSFAIFEIKNINRFLFKVEIEGKKISLQTPVPTELQRLFRLDQKQIDELQGTQNEKVEEAKAAIEEKKKEMEQLSGKPELVAVQNDIKEVVEKCEEYLKLIDKIAVSLSELKIARRSLIVLSQQDIGFNEMSAKLSTITVPNTASIEQTYKTFVTSYTRLEQLYEKAEKKVKSSPIDPAVAFTAAVRKNAEEQVHDALKSIEKNYEVIADEDLLNLIEDVMQLSEGLGNPKNFVVTSPPVQMLDDIASYQVSIHPSATRSFGVYRTTLSFDFDVPTQGGLKVDFSVGPIISFGNNAKDDKYYFDPSVNPEKSSLKKLDNNNFITPSLAAFMHFYRRSGRTGSFGGLFGVGAGFESIDAINLNYIFGGSWVLGKSEKVMLNTGVSIFKVSRLKTDQYKVDSNTTYDPSKVSISDVTEKVFKPSFFLSISYNLTRRVQRN